MSSALYYTRDKKTERALKQLIIDYGLEKGFESNKETIYRGEQILASSAKKYIYLYIYDEHNIALKNSVHKKMCCRG